MTARELTSIAALVLAAHALAGCAGNERQGGDTALGGGAGAGAGASTGLMPSPVSCLPNEQACPEGCFDLGLSAQHCGTCALACAAGEICEAGVCHAACTGTLCTSAVGVECVTLSTDRNHCGACNNPCNPGSICVDSKCVLDCGAQTECNAVCVDLHSDDANCGTCGMACPADRSCTNGECTCPAGSMLCDDACVDISTDAAHCGACGQACSAGDLCNAGHCLGPDGCSDIPVAGLSLSEVAIYQSVKISIMKGLMPVEAGQRNADVVQGREAVFRVHVTPDMGWMPRQVSARIELTAAGASAMDAPKLFFAQMTPAAASSDDALDSTFQVQVPAEALTAGARYAVTLVECSDGPPAGTAQGARFPSDGFADLGARETGPLRVHIVPLDMGGGAPDVSATSLETYRSRVFAVYPVTEVELTVGDPLAASGASMCDLLTDVSARRSADNAPDNVYYFGLTTGTSGGESGCSVASPSARGGKVSAGWASSGGKLETGAGTMCHELGHAHGRQHAPCGVQDPDPSYPYPNADTGVWGHDLRMDTFLEPTRKDMMSYCPNPDRTQAWISDYNYQAILERVVAVNALPEQPFAHQTTAPKVAWRLLVVDTAGTHWGKSPLLVQGTPDGVAVNAVVYDRNGSMQTTQVYKQELENDASDQAYMLTVPEPDAGAHAIEVPGLLAKLPFE